MAYTPPAVPDAPSLSRPSTFEVDTSAFLAWMGNLAQSGIDGDGFVRMADVLGTVSQSGGVPTGALQQYGTNANGQFWRLASGLQICTQFVSSALSADTAAGAVYISASEATWTFPAVFVNSDVSVSCSPRTSNAVWGKGRCTGSTSGAYRLVSSSSTTALISVELSAIGRWY